MTNQICERCTLGFDFPETGGQPDDGDYAGVPLCPDCYANALEELKPDELEQGETA